MNASNLFQHKRSFCREMVWGQNVIRHSSFHVLSIHGFKNTKKIKTPWWVPYIVNLSNKTVMWKHAGYRFFSLKGKYSIIFLFIYLQQTQHRVAFNLYGSLRSHHILTYHYNGTVYFIHPLNRKKKKKMLMGWTLGTANIVTGICVS